MSECVCITRMHRSGGDPRSFSTLGSPVPCLEQAPCPLSHFFHVIVCVRAFRRDVCSRVHLLQLEQDRFFLFFSIFPVGFYPLKCMWFLVCALTCVCGLGCVCVREQLSRQGGAGGGGGGAMQNTSELQPVPGLGHVQGPALGEQFQQGLPGVHQHSNQEAEVVELLPPLALIPAKKRREPQKSSLHCLYMHFGIVHFGMRAPLLLGQRPLGDATAAPKNDRAYLSLT